MELSFKYTSETLKSYICSGNCIIKLMIPESKKTELHQNGDLNATRSHSLVLRVEF